LFNYFYNKIFENFKADEIRNIVLNNGQEEACKILKCTHYGYQKIQDYLYEDIFKRFKEDEIVSILQKLEKESPYP
jgi:predicted house-cleaning noncanonical NTP pyrophosphatase (MazG superfamily)